MRCRWRVWHLEHVHEYPLTHIIHSRLRFARPQWLEALYARRIGVETMDMAAACRTYNILAGEGRRVLVALLIEATPG